MTGPGAVIARICVTVPDLAEAEAFYREALGFSATTPIARCNPDRAALLGAPDAVLSAIVMQLGAQQLELLAFDPPGRTYPAESTSSDLWFQHCAIVTDNMAEACAHLHRCGADPITQGGPQRLPPNTGAVTAFKFRDPAGHPLELLQFPVGVGDAAWHRPDGGVFRGIDHTAIAVRDTATSTAFYRDLLGFQDSGHSDNSGEGQSRLDAVTNDRVAVVALATNGHPPHLELLGYRTGLRRPRPADWGPSDVAITRTLVTVGDFPEARRRVEAMEAPCAAHHGTWDGCPAFTVEDPDGHALIVVSRAR